MRHILIILVFLTGIAGSAFSQESNFLLQTGAGYYMDIGGRVGGEIIWLDGGYKLNTGFNINGRLSMATISWEMESGAFSGYRTSAIRQMADITFSRPVRIKGPHFIEPGFGFKLKRELQMYPDIAIIQDNGQFMMATTYSSVFYEIGFTIYADYLYKFPGGFFLGLRTDTNVIWALGFEGLTISPLVGFRF